MASDVPLAVSDTDETGTTGVAPVTVIPNVALLPSLVARTFVVPAPTAVITPLACTVTIDEFSVE
jgi:hypothetical protein